MKHFEEKYGALATQFANRQASAHYATQEDKKQGVASYLGVLAFLMDNPQSIASVREPFGTHAFFDKSAQRFFKGRFRAELPSAPATVPDGMVSYVMQAAFGYSPQEADAIKLTHQLAMAAENAVGEVLERYIASVLEPRGWFWCSGTLVKAVDFLRYNQQSARWTLLQIKNRDNSENSSSAAIRDGTDIQHWFRTFAKTGQSNWGAFPAVSQEERSLLTEAGFRGYVGRFYERLRSNI